MNSDISKLDKMQSSSRLKLDLFLPELIAFIMSNFLHGRAVGDKKVSRTEHQIL